MSQGLCIYPPFSKTLYCPLITTVFLLGIPPHHSTALPQRSSWKTNVALVFRRVTSLTWCYCPKKPSPAVCLSERHLPIARPSFLSLLTRADLSVGRECCKPEMNYFVLTLTDSLVEHNFFLNTDRILDF